jgi:hypothetical protein
MDTGEKISVEDALVSIMHGFYPHGSPMEPLQEHVMKLQSFAMVPENFSALTPGQAHLLGQYAAAKTQELQQQIQQQQMMQNAAMMQQSVGGQGQPGKPGQSPSGTPPPNTGPGGNAKVQGNELMDESLPGAGGGANPGKQ